MPKITRATPNFLTSSSQWYIWGTPMCSRSIGSYAFCLGRLESDEGKIHVFPHSSKTIKAIELNLFPSSQAWECGHFGTLDVENWPDLAVLWCILWFFEKMGLFRWGGHRDFFWEIFFFFLLPEDPLPIYLTALKGFSTIAGDLKFAKSVPLLVESTQWYPTHRPLNHSLGS